MNEAIREFMDKVGKPMPVAPPESSGGNSTAGSTVAAERPDAQDAIRHPDEVEQGPEPSASPGGETAPASAGIDPDNPAVDEVPATAADLGPSNPSPGTGNTGQSDEYIEYGGDPELPGDRRQLQWCLHRPMTRRRSFDPVP